MSCSTRSDLDSSTWMHWVPDIIDLSSIAKHCSRCWSNTEGLNIESLRYDEILDCSNCRVNSSLDASRDGRYGTRCCCSNSSTKLNYWRLETVQCVCCFAMTKMNRCSEAWTPEETIDDVMMMRAWYSWASFVLILWAAAFFFNTSGSMIIMIVFVRFIIKSICCMVTEISLKRLFDRYPEDG